MTKTIDDYFADWESHTFGFGYGTGEVFTLTALKTFMETCKIREEGTSPNYDYRELERALTPPVAWLLINDLCRVNIIEYGVSPRFAWLSEHGKPLREYLNVHTMNELYEVTRKDQDYVHCYPDYCNCEGAPCSNPFWKNYRK